MSCATAISKGPAVPFAFLMGEPRAGVLLLLLGGWVVLLDSLLLLLLRDLSFELQSMCTGTASETMSLASILIIQNGKSTL